MSIIDPATMYHLYIDEQLSIRSIAAILHVNPRTVHETMIHGRIPRRRRWKKQASLATQQAVPGQIDEALLRQLYLIEYRSIHEIADILDRSPSTVREALAYWNIPRRQRGRPKGNLQPQV
jgi:DNA-directed RNA polymerase specialized sigma24 family protein